MLIRNVSSIFTKEHCLAYTRAKSVLYSYLILGKSKTNTQSAKNKVTEKAYL